jgi:hypothetical protein
MATNIVHLIFFASEIAGRRRRLARRDRYGLIADIRGLWVMEEARRREESL